MNWNIEEAVQEGELETSETVQIGDRTRRQGTDRLSASGHRMIRSGHVRLDLAKKTNPIFRWHPMTDRSHPSRHGRHDDHFALVQGEEVDGVRTREGAESVE